MPWTYWALRPKSTLATVPRLTRPPRPPPVSLTLDVPWSSDARSMKYEGMVEKSVMPSMGLLMRMPFQVTWVWLGEVPAEGDGRQRRTTVALDVDRRAECQDVGHRQGYVRQASERANRKSSSERRYPASASSPSRLIPSIVSDSMRECTMHNAQCTII